MPLKSKPAEKKEHAPAMFEVANVKPIQGKKDSYRMTLIINGVKIYGAKYITYTGTDGKDTSFISFPSYKGADNKYYNVCWYPISDQELAEIEKLMEAALGSGEDVPF